MWRSACFISRSLKVATLERSTEVGFPNLNERKPPCPSRRLALRFKAPAVARDRKAETEINRSNEHVDFDAERLPGGIYDGGLRCRQQVENADDQNQTGILEEREERIHERRDHMPDGLRQDDQPVFLP